MNGPNGRPWHIDHAIPFSRGGSYATENLVLSCASCNTSKCEMTPEEFVDYREGNRRGRGEPAHSGALNSSAASRVKERA